MNFPDRWDVHFPSVQGRRNSKRQILLTFDDGPHRDNTPKLLDELMAAGIKATFFVVGERLETPYGMEVIRRAAAEGHQIGNHSYSHRDLTELPENEIRDEIMRTEELIGEESRNVKILRPPYGTYSPLVGRVAQELGYRLIFWNVDTLDWNPSSRGHWVEHAVPQISARKHSIVLMHDLHATTTTKVGSLIEHIRMISDSSFICYSEAFPETDLAKR